MGCKLTVNRHGRLMYRIYVNGHEFWEGLGKRDTARSRKRAEADAVRIGADIEDGTFDYERWFPEGNKLYLFRPPAEAAAPEPIHVRDYVEHHWMPRKQPPLVRASLTHTYRSDLNCHVLPTFGDKTFADLTVPALEDFRATLLNRETGKGLAVKTARCIIDGTLRALYRDARKDGHAAGDPFAELVWPRKAPPDIDPFDEVERDTLLSHFHDRDRFWFPFVHTAFLTGLRTAEMIGLRWGALDVRKGTLTVRVSRSYDEDNAPKTARSARTIQLAPSALRVLREMPAPLHRDGDAFVFTTPTGRPVDRDRFTAQHWRRALRATEMRPRKFYATRHTFISLAMTKGMPLKLVATYCGTSVEMIEQHYGKWLSDDMGRWLEHVTAKPVPESAIAAQNP